MLDSPDSVQPAALLPQEPRSDSAALAAAAELANLRQTVAQLTFERDRILNSTLWRILSPLRASARLLPPPVQRFVLGTVRRGLNAVAPSRGRGRPAGLETWAPPPAASGVVANRVIFVSGEPDTPGHFYRVVRQLEAASAAGWDASWMHVDDAPKRMDEIATAGIVVIWRSIWSDTIDWIQNVVRRNGARLVFDLDDLAFRTELATVEMIDGIRSQNHDPSRIVEYFAAMRKALAHADACTCTTAELAWHLRAVDKTAFVLPNGFDAAALALSRLSLRRRRAMPQDGLLRIGYATGTRTHQRDFAQAASAVARVLAERPHCRLVLFESADGRYKLLDVHEFSPLQEMAEQIEWWPMRPLNELPEAMALFDINLAPLEVGNPFCEAKSELKYFESALVEVPTIASPTGPMSRAIRHGETGLLASSPEDWYDALIALVDDPERRRRLAHAAYLDVLWSYGPERRTERTHAMLRQVEGGAEGARSFALELARSVSATVVRQPIADSEIIFARDRLGQSAVTVIIPLHNYAHFILEALESVRAQTLEPLDLVVIDDASTDDSLAVAREWMQTNEARFNRILLLRNRANAGLAHTRNAGFDAAETPFVLPLDADNRLLPACCASLLQVARSNNAAFAYPEIRCFGGADHLLGVVPYVPMRMAGGNYIDAMALVAKSAWAAVGGYSHIELGWEDYDFWCLFAERGLLGVKVPEILAEYRVHKASMLRTVTDLDDNRPHVMAALESRHAWLSITYRDQYMDEPQTPQFGP